MDDQTNQLVIGGENAGNRMFTWGNLENESEYDLEGGCLTGLFGFTDSNGLIE